MSTFPSSSHRICNGRGDSGDHCCYIEGEVCQFLDVSGDTPRCTIWVEMDSPKWKKAPVGKWFAKVHPGFNCHDWPQNIPKVMQKPGVNLCCWNEA